MQHKKTLTLSPPLNGVSYGPSPPSFLSGPMLNPVSVTWLGNRPEIGLLTPNHIYSMKNDLSKINIPRKQKTNKELLRGHPLGKRPETGMTYLVCQYLYDIARYV